MRLGYSACEDIVELATEYRNTDVSVPGAGKYDITKVQITP